MSVDTMRPPATIEPWMSAVKMERWAAEAPDENTGKRRLAVWLTHIKKLHAHEVSDHLGVSVQAVWLWIGQYNREGPAGLDRKGRGGRRKAFMTPRQEKKILRPFLHQIRASRPARAAVIKEAVEAKLGRKVSFPYIYSLMSRHGWAQTIAESHFASSPKKEDTFTRLSAPWRR